MRLPIAIASVVAVVAIFAGSGSQVHAQTKNAHPAQKSQPKKEVVIAPGDTLIAIADAHQTTYPRLYDANPKIQNPDIIYPGDKVRVPSADEQLTPRELPANAVAQPATGQTQSYTPASQPKTSAPAVAAPVIQAAPVAGCGDNSYANYIYSHESGCRTTAMSPNGCYGIGQACPASKIASCGADYACQNAFFTSYANKYGGWAGAYNFWVNHGWW